MAGPRYVILTRAGGGMIAVDARLIVTVTRLADDRTRIGLSDKSTLVVEESLDQVTKLIEEG
jgi:Flagellar and Swarming motility proteins